MAAFAPPNTTTVLTLATPLAKCGVLYIGSGVPDTERVGIDSVQECLLKRYNPNNAKENSCIVHGMDAVLIVRDNGLELTLTQDPSLALFYPIKSLTYCASVRYIPSKRSRKPRFVPVDSSTAARYDGDGHPPLFCIVFRRTRNVPGDECHAFVCKTKQSALVLVQSCFVGYSRTDKNQNIAKIPLYIKGEGQDWYEVNDQIKATEAPTSQPVVDFMTSMRSVGFFYKSEQTKIDLWELWDEDKTAVHHKRKHHHSRKKRQSDEYNSSTEYYNGNNLATNVLPKHLQEQYVVAGSSLESSTVDPYAPAPNLVKVQHVKDPETGANVFIRWFEDGKEAPRTVYDSSNMVVEERSVGHKPHGKLKGILRNRARSEARGTKDEGYEISNAYFEDHRGRRHHFSEKRISRIKKRNSSLSDECRRKYISATCSRIESENAAMPAGLPVGAKVLKSDLWNAQPKYDLNED